MNLVIFNVFFSVIYYIFGRYLFGDKLNDNVRYNFSSISRGYMTLITVMTGDGWSDIMYKATLSTVCLMSREYAYMRACSRAMQTHA